MEYELFTGRGVRSATIVQRIGRYLFFTASPAIFIHNKLQANTAPLAGFLILKGGNS